MKRICYWCGKPIDPKVGCMTDYTGGEVRYIHIIPDCWGAFRRRIPGIKFTENKSTDHHNV